MKDRYFSILLTSLLLLTACNDQKEQPPGDNDREEQTYMFTAVLDGMNSRVGYEDDDQTKNLKMVWDDGDIIRLYPDESMNDVPGKHYDFIANTGAGTSSTVFVFQGYIPGWESWSGIAIHVFPGEENVDVPLDDENFVAKTLTQAANNDTRHLKYAEHEIQPDGKKGYTEYWSNHLDGWNLKHDYKLTFKHPHTLVYKIMLRGFIYDVPGGSLLKVSGLNRAGVADTLKLNLGTKDDPDPFLQVGSIAGSQYGDPEYQDNPLIAYIIRQVPPSTDVDAEIKKGEKLKFEVFTYDPDDGKAYPLVEPNDTSEHRHHEYMLATDKDGNKSYFVDLPWGEEYTWEVEASQDVQYKTGDYVVADLLDTREDYSYPHVAVDLGLTQKWATTHVGAKKIEEPGSLFLYGSTVARSYNSGDWPSIENTKEVGKEWSQPADKRYDAATEHWGDEWRMANIFETLDLLQYTTLLTSNGKEVPKVEADFWDQRWENPEHSTRWKMNKIKPSEADLYYSWCEAFPLAKFSSNHKKGKCIYIPMAGTNRIGGEREDNVRGEYARFHSSGGFLQKEEGIHNANELFFKCKYNKAQGWFGGGVTFEAGTDLNEEIKRNGYSIRPVKRNNNEPKIILYYPFRDNIPTEPQRH